MTLGSHQTTIGKSQGHFTPRWILQRLGNFDLDPAAGDPRPWDCARENYTEKDDGLSRPWFGRVWLNPPFHRYEVGSWIAHLAQHGCGTCLLHARVEAAWFQPLWESASGILFLASRIKFCHSDGSEQPYNSGAPALLASFGQGAHWRSPNSRSPCFVHCRGYRQLTGFGSSHFKLFSCSPRDPHYRQQPTSKPARSHKAAGVNFAG